MPNNPAQRRTGATPATPEANKLVRGAELAVALAAVSSTTSASTPSTPDEQTIPRGVIVMWSGLLTAIPTGWALCDGTNSTPDLRDRFIEGWTAGVDPGGTGGAVNHLHGFGTLANSNTSAGTPAGSISTDGAHTHTFTQSANAATPDLLAPDLTATGVAAQGTTDSNGSHTHTFTGDALATHTHTVSGSTAETDGRPPFFKLAFIMKT